VSEETETKKPTYVVDISSIYEVDEKTADDLQVRPNSLNEKWLIEQVKKGNICIVDIVQEDGFEHTGEENENSID
jgi:hypothetical protein